MLIAGRDTLKHGKVYRNGQEAGLDSKPSHAVNTYEKNSLGRVLAHPLVYWHRRASEFFFFWNGSHSGTFGQSANFSSDS